MIGVAAASGSRPAWRPLAGLAPWGALLVALLVASPAIAQPAPPATAINAGGPAWAALTGAQQSALAPLKRDWSGIDAGRKQKWLDIAARFPSLPAEEQRRIQERMTEWARMTPDQRGKARLQFQEVRQISPQDRAARWDAYLALPPEEREALAARSRSVPQAARGAEAPKIGTPVLPNQKVNVLTAPSRPAAPAPVAPMMVQAKPGATTTLISKAPNPPQHEKPGEPKIAVPPGQVNRQTLLPQTPSRPAPASPAAPAATGLRTAADTPTPDASGQPAAEPGR